MSEIHHGNPLSMYAVADGATVTPGELVAINAAGTVVPASDTAGLTVVGIADRVEDGMVEVRCGIIGITNDGLTLSDIREAAKAACLDEAIEGFSKGYDTMVGERGVTLSGGQKQRTAIARMLTQKTPIMVFDDSLSAVDADTDAKIRQELRKNLGDATVILIAHRVTTLMQADCIMVMDKGEIAEIGTHEELMKLNGVYRRIYDMQMTLPEEGGETA